MVVYICRGEEKELIKTLLKLKSTFLKVDIKGEG